MKRLFAILCRLLPLLLLLLLGCREQQAELPPVLFQVGNRIVTLAQFQKHFRATLPADAELSPEERTDLERSYLAQAIDRELILGEAERLGVSVPAAEIEAALSEAQSEYEPGAFASQLAARGVTLDDWRLELRDSLLMEKVVKLAVTPRVQISDAQVQEYYQANKEQFERPEQVRARQILVESEAQGEQLLGLLRGGADFAEIAEQYSLSPDAEQGGDLGFFARGEMPQEFDDTVFKLAVGRISDLVKSPYGVHIFLVEEKRPAKSLKLAEASTEIRKLLQRQAEELAYQQWLQELRSQAKININMTLLAEKP